jgi:hypothetical protein
MDELRKPFLILALVLMVIVVLIEIGSAAFLHGVPPPSLAPSDLTGNLDGPLKNTLGNALGDVDSGDLDDMASASDDIPGMGIPYMAVLDGVVLFSVVLIGAGLLVPESVQGRIQGCATFIFALLLVLGAIVAIFAAIALLLLMIGLLLAVPFGTIAYLAIYGFFNRGGASTVLGLLMLLKLGFAVSLVVAQQRFLQNKGLVLLVISSLLGNIVISFLQGFVPSILVSITDDIAAIIVAACGCIWGIFLLIGAVPAILKVIRVQG